MPERLSITRREFLKVGGVFAIATFFPNIEFSQRNSMGIIPAEMAAKYAQSLFGNRPYKFGKSDCGMYAARFASYYGIPIGRYTTQTRIYKPRIFEDLLLDATSVKQVRWFENANKYI